MVPDVSVRVLVAGGGRREVVHGVDGDFARFTTLALVVFDGGGEDALHRGLVLTPAAKAYRRLLQLQQALERHPFVTDACGLRLAYLQDQLPQKMLVVFAWSAEFSKARLRNFSERENDIFPCLENFEPRLVQLLGKRT